MSACRSRAVPRLWRARIGFTFGLSARAGAGGHGATLGHAPAPRGGFSGQCAKPLRMATRDPTLDRRAHLLGSQSESDLCPRATPLRAVTQGTVAASMGMACCEQTRAGLCVHVNPQGLQGSHLNLS